MTLCRAFFMASVIVIGLGFPTPAAEPLPNTNSLTEEGDLAAKMVAGIHKYLDRELANAPKRRDEVWKANANEPVAAKRERLTKLLGVVDARLPQRIENYGKWSEGTRVTPTDGKLITRIRWDVLPGFQAEGIFILGKGEKRFATVIAVPDSNQIPEQLAMGEYGKNIDPYVRHLVDRGCDVIIPTLLNRSDTQSGNAVLKRATNQSHREFVQRMSFEMGRTAQGLEVQQILAILPEQKDIPYDVIGFGDGGRTVLLAAALDERIRTCHVAGAFCPQESLWQRPLDRNVWGMLNEFGDAELAAMISPRKLIVDPVAGPSWEGNPTKQGRSGAAPGSLAPIAEAEVKAEFARIKTTNATITKIGESQVNVEAFLTELKVPTLKIRGGTADVIGEVQGIVQNEADKPNVVQKRLVDRQVSFTQKLWRDSDAVRKEFWKKADASTPQKWEQSCDWYREYFHSEVIGKLPEPTVPLNPRSRQVYDEKDFSGYEVMLDVYDDVFAQGILLLPKGLKPTDKRPVVVCQHGLEGTPRKCIDAEKGPTYFEFARKLVAKGYVVYCPQNPYYGGNTFRQIQRKANPLKLSLFSFIIRQHQRTIDWLETLPNVEKSKIAFYGLSYGGKTAMRVPAVEKRYCLSICSGDFNEWIGKNVSVDLDRSYMWTGEYEMYEFDLGHTFNYAEMAYLIAPRPFMVERGHDDPVGTDEMVASEYAKVRYLYANRLKLPERTAIDFQPGGHQIFLKGTMAFLEKEFGKP